VVLLEEVPYPESLAAELRPGSHLEETRRIRLVEADRRRQQRARSIPQANRVQQVC
jgi:hypothetical protein